MSFPIGPVNNQTAVVNGITYVYSSANNAWTRVTATNLTLAGNLTTGGNVTIAGNLTVQGNTTTLNTETLTVEDLNITVANGAATAAAADGAGLTVAGANARLLYKSVTDSWIFDRGVFASGNLVANSGTTSSSTTTGALVVTGGVGVAGNVFANTIYTTTGIRWAGNSASFSSGGGGITYTASTDPPAAGNVAGDQWYNTVNDTLYEYLSDGTTAYWVDIQSPIIVTTGSTGGTTDTLHPFLLAGM